MCSGKKALMKDVESISAKGRVAIIGLGYVGLPLALAFVKAGSDVVGIDRDPAKAMLLAAKKSYLRHIESREASCTSFQTSLPSAPLTSWTLVDLLTFRQPNARRKTIPGSTPCCFCMSITDSCEERATLSSWLTSFHSLPSRQRCASGNFLLAASLAATWCEGSGGGGGGGGSGGS